MEAREITCDRCLATRVEVEVAGEVVEIRSLEGRATTTTFSGDEEADRQRFGTIAQDYDRRLMQLCEMGTCPGLASD